MLSSRTTNNKHNLQVREGSAEWQGGRGVAYARSSVCFFLVNLLIGTCFCVYQCFSTRAKESPKGPKLARETQDGPRWSEKASGIVLCALPIVCRLCLAHLGLIFTFGPNRGAYEPRSSERTCLLGARQAQEGSRQL